MMNWHIRDDAYASGQHSPANDSKLLLRQISGLGFHWLGMNWTFFCDPRGFQETLSKEADDDSSLIGRDVQISFCENNHFQLIWQIQRWDQTKQNCTAALRSAAIGCLNKEVERWSYTENNHALSTKYFVQMVFMCFWYSIKLTPKKPSYSDKYWFVLGTWEELSSANYC